MSSSALIVGQSIGMSLKCQSGKGRAKETGLSYESCENCDNCEHIVFIRRLFRNGEIRPPVCKHCGTENEFPLNVGLENGKYVFRCVHCNRTILKEGGEK